jgi:hypothetical protein
MSRRISARRKAGRGVGKWFRSRLVAVGHTLQRLGSHARQTPSRALRRLRTCWRAHTVAVEVFIAEQPRRRRLERAVRAALRQLQRAAPASADVPVVTAVVLTQHVVAGGRQLAGCVHVQRRAGHVATALVRLALQVHGRDLTDDEVLAVFAEQWIGLAVEHGGPSVLVPTEGVASPSLSSVPPALPAPPGQTVRPNRPTPPPAAGLSADPLVPVTPRPAAATAPGHNGRHGGPHPEPWAA